MEYLLQPIWVFFLEGSMRLTAVNLQLKHHRLMMIMVFVRVVSFIKSNNPGLLITLDFGTSNYNEINDLASLGIKVIVLDHHEIL